MLKVNPDLTPREIEVLQCLADGVGFEADVGKVLHISRETVKNHLCHIHAKLDTKNQAGAIASGFRLGLIH